MARIRFIKTCAFAALLSAGSIGAAHAEGFYFGVFGGVDSADSRLSRAAEDGASLAVLDASGFDVDTFHSSVDDSGKVWGLQIGYAFNNYVATEVGYVDLGKVGYKGTFDGTAGGEDATAIITDRFRSRGPTLAVVGMFPFADQRFDVHARAGLLFSRTDELAKLKDRASNESVNLAGVHASDNDLFAGIGANWNINATYALRVEYTHFIKVGADETTGEADVDMFTVGILFR